MLVSLTHWLAFWADPTGELVFLHLSTMLSSLQVYLSNELYTVQLLRQSSVCTVHIPCIFFHLIVIRILTVILTLIYKIKRNYCNISGDKYTIIIFFYDFLADRLLHVHVATTFSSVHVQCTWTSQKDQVKCVPLSPSLYIYLHHLVI